MTHDERKFIHDLSNPLAIAFGNLRLVSKGLEENPQLPPSPEMLVRMEKVMESFEKIIELLAERRRDLQQNAVNI